MKRFFLLMALMCSSLTWALGNSEEIVGQLTKRLSQRTIVRADFVQEKQITHFKKPLVTRGKMLFVQNQGVLWKIESPLHVTYVLTEDRIIEIPESGQSQTRTTRDVPGLAQIGRIFRALLGAQTTALADLFTVDGEITAERWKLALSPKPGPVAQFMKQIRLEGTRHVERIRIDEANGDSTLIVFSNPREDEKLSQDEQSLLRRP